MGTKKQFWYRVEEPIYNELQQFKTEMKKIHSVDFIDSQVAILGMKEFKKLYSKENKKEKRKN